MSKIGLIGKKIGMSREFLPIGMSIPVTVIKIEKGRVIDVITKDKRGYDAIRVGFGKIKSSKLTKSMKGFFSKRNTEPKRYLKEYRVKNISNYKEGNEIGLEIFEDTKYVDATSKTIGKGFAGVMKRHNFSGLRASHGVSISHRSGGSTGQRQDPGKVFKGKKMPGHMGDKFRTILNLEVIKSDLNNDLIYLKGSIPGTKNTTVFLRNSVKTIIKAKRLSKTKDMEKETSSKTKENKELTKKQEESKDNKTK
jgi:large subunit ribosomal protein L3